MTVAVIKIGVGNTASVMFALERLGADAVLTEDADRVADAERVVLPGVGAAAHAMAMLDAKGLSDALRAYRRPLLGICLGQQLLYRRSAEGAADGLALLDGEVTALASSTALPSPHMGWSALQIARKHDLLEGVSTGDYCYFVHSYACPIDANTIVLATYGKPFAAVVAKGNVMGCQFHPERSGVVGARILRNFLAFQC